MRWKNRRRSTNIEDRRSIRPAGAALGGGAAVVVVIIALLFGADPQQLLEQAGGMNTAPAGGQSQSQVPVTDPHEEELKGFASVVLADTEEAWTKIFAGNGLEYEYPTLVFFSGQVESACGYASAAVGPFYCPSDHNLYLDLTFFDQLSSRLNAPGDFPWAYVIAHEVGHHVQNQLGTLEQVHNRQQGLSKTEANELSVRLELQADFYAGVWAHYAERQLGVLDPGDIEEAMRAAAAIGDDNLQRQSQGYVVPDSFTHGTSEQRMQWFMKGFKTGDPSQGDTFSIANP